MRGINASWFRGLPIAFALLLWSQPSAADSDLLRDLHRQAPALSSRVLELALDATRCAASRLDQDPPYLAVIDYSKPSTARRFWLFDLRARRLVTEELVAHGRNSGENFATRFSNRPGSYQSSLGLFLAAESYTGRHGTSLRLDGLEPGFNDQARKRAIVIHGADYVSQAFVRRAERLGRSQGCPALPRQSAGSVIQRLREGSFVFAYYPDRAWLDGSPYLAACERDTPAHQRLARATVSSRTR